jgi:hypothetical protein
MDIAERANHYLNEVDGISNIPENIEPIEIYFDDLISETQLKIINVMKKISNVLDDDSVAENDIRIHLVINPILIIVPEEFKHKMNIRV